MTRRQQLILSTFSILFVPFAMYDCYQREQPFWLVFWALLGLAHGGILWREIKRAWLQPHPLTRTETWAFAAHIPWQAEENNVTTLIRNKIRHKANLISNGGKVSPLCSKQPRALDLSKESWTLRDDEVTCSACWAAIAASGTSTPGQPGSIPS